MNCKNKSKGFWFFAGIIFLMLITTCSVNLADTVKDQTKTHAKLAPHAQSALSGEQMINLQTDDVPDTLEPDLLEHFNRSMFIFNEKLDTYVMKPIATLYIKVVPKPLNQGIHNFFNNLCLLPTIANDILQLHFYQMLNDLWRLAINSTIGIGGLFDVATHIGLECYSNDFGLTLARWGWRNSTYIVLPFFGPNTIRDGIKIPVDYYAFSVYPYINPPSTRYKVLALCLVDKRAQLLQFQPVLEEAALDKYIFLRNVYLQQRAQQIEQNAHHCYLYNIK